MAFVAALLCGLLGGFLAWHYPIAPWAMLLTFALTAATAFLRPRLWLFAVPALIPLIGFAPWTGWLLVEEVDLLVLGAAAGGYAQLAWRRRLPRDAARFVEAAVGSKPHLSLVGTGVVVLFGLSTTLALYRGLTTSGGLEWDWFAGYHDALNSLRIWKSFALALLLLPLLLIELRRSDDRALDFLAEGFAFGAGVTALAVAWERIAFTGLTNFSTDYRATGMFWEMHVGGAALDGFLALAVPFVIWAVMHSPGRKAAVAVGLALLTSYACLTTFSRGVYLAVPTSLGLMLLLLSARTRTLPQCIAFGVVGALSIGALVIASNVVFRAGGYRSLTAVLGVLAVLLPLSSIAHGATLRQWAVALGTGGAVAMLGAGVAAVVAKGPYVVYALVLAGCVWLAWPRQLARQRVAPIPLVLAAYVWLSLAAAMVALHWGGSLALTDASICLLALLVLMFARSRSLAPPWPIRPREQGALVASAIVVAGAVAVMSGGAYMGDRFAAVEKDFGARIQHWRDGLGLLATRTEWLLGKGAGRFPQDYFFSVRAAVFPGSYRIANENGNGILVLSGPRYPTSFGDLFRVSQRVGVAQGLHTVTFDARAPSPVRLHIEICEQHLLYNGACAIASPSVVVKTDSWQRYVLTLDGRKLGGGPWYAPRLGFFALAVASEGKRLDVDNISLIGPGGRESMDNGDFGTGMAHWFIVSERHHLPWHIKNLAFNVLFEQGAIGLALFTLLVGGSFWRLTVGRARGHPMAPFLAAALLGFLVVGAFDSLLDVPRVALTFYLLVLVGLVLQAPSRAARAHPGSPG